MVLLVSELSSIGVETMKSKRLQIREQRRRRQLYSRFIWGIVGLVGLGVLAYGLWVAFRPSYGESIPVMADSSHVSPDTNPGPYNSDPPTSGRHYADSLPAGFYDEEDLASLPEHPEGLLVHSLEHGYVIFWYNCDALDEQGCGSLKSQIQQAMNEAGNLKVIAFPWKSIDVPVVMTSWGRMLRLEQFNLRAARTFIERNRNRAPEPNAP